MVRFTITVHMNYDAAFSCMAQLLGTSESYLVTPALKGNLKCAKEVRKRLAKAGSGLSSGGKAKDFNDPGRLEAVDEATIRSISLKGRLGQ